MTFITSLIYSSSAQQSHMTQNRDFAKSRHVDSRYPAILASLREAAGKYSSEEQDMSRFEESYTFHADICNLMANLLFYYFLWNCVHVHR
ncbi:hypothetical protein GDO86_017916 [Hymenochirus boettgeri]|uniref:Uncharacterized protein n=1 Tax=Hymenochirus boettgeri TaxID=247094 RepID=A0A8T2IET9_9PIPI|nr:hypothetical protein GDO86_017916 [Hymenochirus boettgeri]